ncbi:MAG: hypothetical protein LBB36_05980 [Fibromonadaceae bacterium]|jgi:hypothetical protein|nr:hypothetical protein [Fibromonadaceae bacterium]
MSVVGGILKEERGRLEAQLLKYENKLLSLPNAAIKKRDKYLYYVRRKGKKILTEYIGELSCEKAKKAIELDAERKKYKQRKKTTLLELKEVRRILGKRAI